MEVPEMKPYDFGRRLVDSGSRAMVPVPEAVNGKAPDTLYLTDVKERVRAILLTRIDAGVAGTMSRQLLRSEIAPIVREIATEERVQLNSVEEVQLADELTADMVGLGPLEALVDA